MIVSETKSEQLRDIILSDMRKGVYGGEAAIPSIRELCRRYGVCKHTASQAMNGLKELGLVDVAHGKLSKLSSRAAKRIVHVLSIGANPTQVDEFWSGVYKGMERAFASNLDYECQTLSLPPGDSIGNLEMALNPLTSRGILLVGSSNPFKIEFLKRLGLPFVIVCQKYDDGAAHYVAADIEEAMAAIVRKFKGKGRRRLAFLGPIGVERGAEHEKMEIFKRIALRLGLTLDESHIANSSYELETAYSAALSLFKSKSRPDALFVSSDSLCLPVYRALYDCGLKAPEDIAIASCDNLDRSKFMAPSLCTIDIPRDELGFLAVKSLLKIMDGKPVPKRQTIKAKAIFRESI